MSDPTKVLINSMVTYGNHLKTAKTNPNKENLTTIHAEVTNLTWQLLKQLQNVQHPLFPEKIILKILEKIEASLQKFKELDPYRCSAYEDLLNKTKECKSQKKQAFEKRSASSAGVSLQDASPANGESTQAAEVSASDGPGQQQEEFIWLGNVENKCLFCFCLFPPGKAVKKREPIHVWIGMDLVADSFKGGVILDRLVGLGFIECTTGNNNMFKRYLIKEQVRSIVVKEMNIDFNKDNTLSIMYKNQKQKQPHHQQDDDTNQDDTNQDDVNVSGSLVLNKNENTTLQSKDFESIFKQKNNVKVLHLGNWFHDIKSHIVVEAESLKTLTRHIGHVAFLSLQGVSGIVELPDSVYKLINLKVTHLDLSECYLLDHIPKGVASLTALRVFKGFIINHEASKMGNRNKKNKRNTSSDASFSQLKDLRKLIKLTIRTRRGDFPTADDLVTLCAMEELANLKITWVCNYKTYVSSVCGSERFLESFEKLALQPAGSGRFPESLKKLELQATPENTLRRLVELISDHYNPLHIEKLYIRGGPYTSSKILARASRC